MVKIILPGEFTDLNTYSDAERKHRQIAAEIKRDETERVWVEVLDQKTPRVLSQPIFVRISWYCSNKKKDPDNISFAKKFILDGLQKAGVLDNDGWKQVAGFSDDFHIDKDNPRVEVNLSVV